MKQMNEEERIRYLECCELAGEQEAFAELNNTKNQSNEIYKFTAMLAVKGIQFADILDYMGYTEIYVYGAGEIGQMFMEMLEGRIKVRRIIDKTNMEDIQSGWLDIMDNELPIIVTPSAYFQEISYRLMKLGIVRQRIHAVHTILSFAMKYMYPGKTNLCEMIPYKQRKHFLITGAQFTNKGSQSMLFTAVSEIRKRFQNAVIWYLAVDGHHIYTKEIKNRYDFLFLTDGYDLKAQLYEILTELTAIVDVSGYVLSSLWDHCGRYFRMLRFAYWYGIPLYLMPQSYGPFDFPDEIQKGLKKYLPAARHIYAREPATYQQMKDIYGLKNLSLSNDLVLQNSQIEKNYIYYENKSAMGTMRLDTLNNVAMIPNERNNEFAPKEKTLRVYLCFVAVLLERNKNIYLVSHSGEGDQAICEAIYEEFRDNPQVHFVKNEMDCIEFEKFTTNFQYMVASRFHAIVHGYKNGVPSIAIGWAEKYKALLSAFYQENYQFDIREEISKERIRRAVLNMDACYQTESERILQNLSSIQKENCFDILEELRG